jgi:hypothetical protein
VSAITQSTNTRETNSLVSQPPCTAYLSTLAPEHQLHVIKVPNDCSVPTYIGS